MTYGFEGAVMKCMLAFVFSLSLVGCASSELAQVDAPETTIEPSQSIGYLGFKDHQNWAIKFNDCTVYDLTGAQPYQWFDRTSASVSCYTFKPSDAIAPLPVYSSASFESDQLTSIERFQELQVSYSGWGRFPIVYDKNGTNWLRVKEGWIHLTLADQTLVQFYPGTQDQSAKSQHDQYFEHH